MTAARTSCSIYKLHGFSFFFLATRELYGCCFAPCISGLAFKPKNIFLLPSEEQQSLFRIMIRSITANLNKLQYKNPSKGANKFRRRNLESKKIKSSQLMCAHLEIYKAIIIVCSVFVILLLLLVLLLNETNNHAYLMRQIVDSKKCLRFMKTHP